ncbi:MAG TPA: LysE family transporter [Chitinophagaceae bacterium]|nr:LysE family transporter [Chitinophagaceae bacterium]
MLEAVLKGLGIGLILVLSVGPVIFTIIKQSINNGYKGGFSFVAGVWLSDILLVLFANFFSELVTELLAFKNTIAYIGSIFLAGMGIYYIFFKKVNLNAGETMVLRTFSKTDFSRIALSGFLINTLNPSVLIFWLINATAFATIHSFWERMIIFSVCLGINMIADVLKVLMAGKIRNSLTPRHILLINKVSGTILVIFGAVLMYGALVYKT